MEKFKKFLSEIQNPRILDVGTGVGNFIYIITQASNQYEEIIGIDVMQRMIEFATKNFAENPKVHFEVMDVMDMNFDDETFDIVAFSNSMHHVADFNEIVKKMARVLKKGGLLIVHEMIKNHLNDAQISHRLVHHFAAKIDRHLGMVHDETLDKEDIISICKNIEGFILEDYWDAVYDETDIDPQAGVDSLCNTVDQLLKRIKDEDFLEQMQQEGEELKVYFKENGILSATQLFLVLKKV